MAFWNNPSDLLPKQQHRWVISFGEPQSNEPDNWFRPSVIPHYFAKSVDRPSFKIDSLQAKYLYAHAFNFPKRLIWNPIKIEFYDVLVRDNGRDGYIVEYPIEPAINDKNKSRVRDNYNRDGSNKSYQKSTQLFFQHILGSVGYYNPNEYEKEDLLLRFRDYHFKNGFNRALGGQPPNSLQDDGTDYSKNYLCIAELDGDGKTIEKWRLYNPLITSLNSGKLDYSVDGILSITVDLVYDWAALIPMNEVKVPEKPKIKEQIKPEEKETKKEKNKPITELIVAGDTLINDKNAGSNVRIISKAGFDDVEGLQKAIDKYESIDDPETKKTVQELKQRLNNIIQNNTSDTEETPEQIFNEASSRSIETQRELQKARDELAKINASDTGARNEAQNKVNIAEENANLAEAQYINAIGAAQKIIDDQKKSILSESDYKKYEQEKIEQNQVRYQQNLIDFNQTKINEIDQKMSIMKIERDQATFSLEDEIDAESRKAEPNNDVIKDLRNQQVAINDRYDILLSPLRNQVAVYKDAKMASEREKQKLESRRS